jgi:hypothetical protein
MYFVLMPYSLFFYELVHVPYQLTDFWRQAGLPDIAGDTYVIQVTDLVMFCLESKELCK